MGTFKFVANSMGLTLDKTVTYFIWAIMLVFDPLAVCLVLCFNYLIKDISSKKKAKTPVVEPVSIPTPTTNPTPSTLPIEAKVEELVDTPIPQTRKVHEDQITRMTTILEAQRKERAFRNHNSVEEAYKTEK